jgi:hypothetical protein
MSGTSGISRALLLKSPATRPSALLPRFPCPPLHLGSPETDLIHSTLASPLPAGFLLLPRFFDWPEQQLLLSAALERLERLGGVRRRADGAKRRSTKAELQARRDLLQGQGQGLEGWFRDEAEYNFQTVCDERCSIRPSARGPLRTDLAIITSSVSSAGSHGLCDASLPRGSPLVTNTSCKLPPGLLANAVRPPRAAQLSVSLAAEFCPRW